MIDYKKENLIADLAFCKVLMDRLVAYADAYVTDGYCCCDANHTVVQNDIIRLRRELNEIRIKLS